MMQPGMLSSDTCIQIKWLVGYTRGIISSHLSVTAVSSSKSSDV